MRAHCYGRSLFLILMEFANNANFIPWHDLSLIVRRMTDTVNSSLYRLSRTNRLAFRRFVRINISAPTSSRQHQTKNLARLSDLKKKLHAERKLGGIQMGLLPPPACCSLVSTIKNLAGVKRYCPRQSPFHGPPLVWFPGRAPQVPRNRVPPSNKRNFVPPRPSSESHVP